MQSSNSDTAGGFGSNTPSTFANVKKFFSPASQGTSSPALPFSYADPGHTKTAPPPKASNTGSWLTSPWSTANNPNSSSASSWLNPSTSWFETLGMTRIQRYVAFAICLVAAALFFFLAMFNLVFAALFPRKFAIPISLSSLLLTISFGFVHGHISYIKHLISPERRWLTISFMGSTIICLWVSFKSRSYILTILTAILQFVCMLAYGLSYLPGGRAGIQTVASMATGSLFSSSGM